MAPHAEEVQDDSGYFPVYFKTGLLNNVSAEPGAHEAEKQLPPAGSLHSIVWDLSDAEISEIECAARGFLETGLQLSLITAETFPLPTLGPRLRRASAAIHDPKIGAVLLRGLQSFKYTPVDNVVIHAGLTSHVGGKRAMPGAEGGDKTVLHHIVNIVPTATAEYHGPPNQDKSMPMHTDTGDITSLYTLARSQTGGSTYLARLQDVLTTIRGRRPELADELTKEWTIIDHSFPKGYVKRPLLFIEGGRTLINCSRVRITGSQSLPRPSHLPPLSTAQRLTLDALHAVGMSRAIKVDLQAGDLLLFNNLSMLHARDAYTDKEEIGRRRHLLRIIVRDDEHGWPVPEPLRATWVKLYEHPKEEELLPVKEELFSRATSH